MAKTTKSDNNYHVPNLERGFQILEYMSGCDEGQTITDVVNALGFPKNSVFRILMSLLGLGYLDRDDDTKRFVFTRRLMILGMAGHGEDSLVSNAIDLMRSLRDAVKETVLIGALGQNEVTVLEHVPGSHAFKFSVDTGTRVPLHAAAPGKAILAYLPDKERDEIMTHMSFEKYNDRTLITAEAYREELKEVKATGYGLDNAEQLDGVHCIAAPIFNHHSYPIGSVWITGPASRIPSNQFPALGKHICTCAQRISERLGYRAE